MRQPNALFLSPPNGTPTPTHVWQITPRAHESNAPASYLGLPGARPSAAEESAAPSLLSFESPGTRALPPPPPAAPPPNRKKTHPALRIHHRYDTGDRGASPPPAQVRVLVFHREDKGPVKVQASLLCGKDTLATAPLKARGLGRRAGGPERRGRMSGRNGAGKRSDGALSFALLCPAPRLRLAFARTAATRLGRLSPQLRPPSDPPHANACPLPP